MTGVDETSVLAVPVPEASTSDRAPVFNPKAATGEPSAFWPIAAESTPVVSEVVPVCDHVSHVDGSVPSALTRTT